MSHKEEQVVFFAYGIQTTEEKHGWSTDTRVERIQLWILEDVASHLLDFPEDDESYGGSGGGSGGKFLEEKEGS